MKYIFLGIKDYCKDCWHDWLRNRVLAYGGRVYDKAYYEDETLMWYVADAWKEGSVWHYIRQRKYAKKNTHKRRVVLHKKGGNNEIL